MFIQTQTDISVYLALVDTSYVYIDMLWAWRGLSHIFLDWSQTCNTPAIPYHLWGSGYKKAAKEKKLVSPLFHGMRLKSAANYKQARLTKRQRETQTYRYKKETHWEQRVQLWAPRCSCSAAVAIQFLELLFGSTKNWKLKKKNYKYNNSNNSKNNNK